MVRAAAVVLLSALAGCASPGGGAFYVNEAAPPDDAPKALAQCRYETYSATTGMKAGLVQVYEQSKLFDSCMVARGYTRVR